MLKFETIKLIFGPSIGLPWFQWFAWEFLFFQFLGRILFLLFFLEEVLGSYQFTG